MRVATATALGIALGGALAFVSVACSTSPVEQAVTPDAAVDDDARSDGPAPRDGAGDVEAAADGAAPGGACTFNRDCTSAERCECDEATGCSCKPGARGTGKAGVDPCTTGNDCESSLCVEGPGDAGTSYCSGECTGPGDCGPKLPVCASIASLGRVCIRSPDGGR